MVHQRPHRRRQPREVQRIGLPAAGPQVVQVGTPEQLLLHLSLQRGGDLRVVTEVDERLMEGFGDDGQASVCIESLRGPLLYEEDVIPSVWPAPATPSCGSEDGHWSAGADSVLDVGDGREVGQVALSEA